MWVEILIFASGAAAGGAALRFPAEHRADRQQADHEAETHALQSKLTAVERQRDSALDALHTLATAVETGDGIDTALDRAHWTLAGGDYTGRLRAAQEALVQAEDDIDALAAHLHEYGCDDFDEHAARAIAIVRAEAEQIEPSPDALDRIYARIKDHTC